MNIFGRALMFVGILLLFFGFYLFWQRNTYTRVAFEKDIPESVEIKENPIRLRVSSKKIDVELFEGKITNHKWEVTDRGANFIGNVFYGHNWNNLLGSLVYVTPGETIEIEYENHINVYKIVSTQIVNPDQTNVLKLDNDNNILLYTCTGLFDSKRFIVVAEPERNNL
jgi:LPXTG-site transpeptidase (sortase) family protein